MLWQSVCITLSSYAHFIVNCGTCKCIQDLSKIQDPFSPEFNTFRTNDEHDVSDVSD